MALKDSGRHRKATETIRKTSPQKLRANAILKSILS